MVPKFNMAVQHPAGVMNSSSRHLHVQYIKAFVHRIAMQVPCVESTCVCHRPARANSVLGDAEVLQPVPAVSHDALVALPHVAAPLWRALTGGLQGLDSSEDLKNQIHGSAG